MKKRKKGRMPQSELKSEDDRSSTMGVIYDEHDNGHVIEVSAGEFYEGTIADPEFIASLHAFPLKGTTNLTGLHIKGTSIGDKIQGMARIAERTTADLAVKARLPIKSIGSIIPVKPYCDLRSHQMIRNAWRRG